MAAQREADQRPERSRPLMSPDPDRGSRPCAPSQPACRRTPEVEHRAAGVEPRGAGPIVMRARGARRGPEVPAAAPAVAPPRAPPSAGAHRSTTLARARRSAAASCPAPASSTIMPSVPPRTTTVPSETMCRGEERSVAVPEPTSAAPSKTTSSTRHPAWPQPRQELRGPRQSVGPGGRADRR